MPVAPVAGPRSDASCLLQLLAAAAAAGLHVFLDGERLVVRGRRDSDLQLVQALLARKADLLPLLQAPTEADEREQFEERAAIAEFEGGLPRAAAERIAVAELAATRASRRTADLFFGDTGRSTTTFNAEKPS